ncbi:MAG: acyltransferase family protein [Syntrophobacteraceae bacterium]
MNISDKPRYMLLNACRGIAIVWIVYFHILGNVDRSDLRDQYGNIIGFIIKHGYLGNVLFFVISGYCIGSSLDRALAFDEPPYKWLWNRLKRIYLPYWWSLLFIVVIIPIVSAVLSYCKSHTMSIQFYQFTPLEWLQYVSLVRVFSSTDWDLAKIFGPLNGPIWYIAVAVQIYIIVSISLFLKNRYWILLSTVFAVSLLANLSYTISIVPYGLFLPFFSQFYIGLAVYWAIKSDIIGQLGSYLYITLMVCILIMVIGISMYTVNLNELFAFIFGVIILVLHPYDKYYSRLFMIRWLSIIGLFSYSLYLIHVRLSDLWFMIVRNLIPILSPVLATPCITIPCVVLSAYIWYCFFEKQVSILDVLVGLRHPFREVANRRELSH